MTRIPPVNRSDFDETLRAATDDLADADLGSLRVYAHAPNLAIAWKEFISAVYAFGKVSARTIELMRLRIASHNQCPRCMSLRLDPDDIEELTVCQLDSTPVADVAGLTDAERLAVRFGELMAADHTQIDDALFEELAKHYSNEELVELAMKAATFVGFGRLGAVIRLVDDLPEKYSRPGRLSYLSDD